jgi:hypothetical protein
MVSSLLTGENENDNKKTDRAWIETSGEGAACIGFSLQHGHVFLRLLELAFILHTGFGFGELALELNLTNGGEILCIEDDGSLLRGDLLDLAFVETLQRNLLGVGLVLAVDVIAGAVGVATLTVFEASTGFGTTARNSAGANDLSRFVGLETPGNRTRRKNSKSGTRRKNSKSGTRRKNSKKELEKRN